MEQLKVIKKDILVLNLVVFLLLSFAFLYLQYAYRHHLSPFSLAYLRKSLELFWYALIPLGISAWMVWRHHRYSATFFAICVWLISFKVVEGLFIEFNKIIVVALFFYGVISYFLYQLFQYYLSLASLNANFSQTDLFKPLLREIPCTVKIEDQDLTGYLTNWDEEGCFIKLAKPLSRAPGSSSLTIHFKGRDFTQNGEVVAHSVDLAGVGLKFGSTTKDLTVFNWTEFTELVHELGYKPERLR
jgi:hypothetical protein